VVKRKASYFSGKARAIFLVCRQPCQEQMDQPPNTESYFTVYPPSSASYSEKVLYWGDICNAPQGFFPKRLPSINKTACGNHKPKQDGY
jgi:hypothetical protein